MTRIQKLSNKMMILLPLAVAVTVVAPTITITTTAAAVILINVIVVVEDVHHPLPVEVAVGVGVAVVKDEKKIKNSIIINTTTFEENNIIQPIVDEYQTLLVSSIYDKTIIKLVSISQLLVIFELIQPK